MGRIKILPEVIANKIAAGEVVERPASVVKELLENSLDAGATRIRIEIEAGGKKRIHISDDGCGMVRDDALLAFERHATSKLRSADDLLSIATLGFRGEALPAIGAVSRLLLETRALEETSGTRVEIAGGRVMNVQEAGLPPGTSITVNNLFYNVPARRRFLRSEPTELSHITSTVTHYSLAHPEISFQLMTPGGELVNVSPTTSVSFNFSATSCFKTLSRSARGGKKYSPRLLKRAIQKRTLHRRSRSSSSCRDFCPAPKCRSRTAIPFIFL
jgi:DNA mismatch repair protein MutL